jgi:GT2 family glycosyltransferase
MKPIVSTITPFWSYGPEADEQLKLCIDSIDADEIIIVANEPNARGEPCVGMRVNQGLRLAHGDFLVVIMSSVILESGSMRDLCVPDTITSPNVDDLGQAFHGCCCCIPRAIYEKHGGWDETFTAVFVDDDYLCRMFNAGIEIKCVPSVKVRHVGGSAHARLDAQRLWEENRYRFLLRWGDEQLSRKILDQLGANV